MWKVAVEICKLVEPGQSTTSGLLVHDDRLFFDGVCVQACKYNNEFEVFVPGNRPKYVSGPEAAARAAHELAKQGRH